MEPHFNPELTERKWYAEWMRHGLFDSKPDHREPFSIVIPPPNVTGVLHMGHMLNNTIQDILIRHARQQGKNACWVPGTDHASIATEAKVVQLLRSQGIRKSDISREKFLEHAWEWKEKYGGIILDQLQKLGASCDWKRTAFTMDEVRSEAVIKAFVDLFHKGKLYRGKRMIQWDPEAKTVLSNEEVLYQQEQAQLYHILYKFEDSETEGIAIATQRPETIMADTAVCVHPDDERYKNLIGKKVIIPLIHKAIPVIADAYIDPEFGTGALKVTPAHDPNDYEIGIRHQLEVIDCLNEDGTLNEHARILVGEDRFVARKKIGPLLDAEGVLVKIENYTTNIGRSERTGAVVEPRLSLQWFVKMRELAQPALNAVESDEIQFIPEHFKNTYRHWMENIRDWCISRQLWWGHRIPAWYLGEDIFVAENEEQALQLARTKTGNTSLIIEDLQQDDDVLDTWFSSWLWPISVFDGAHDTDDFKYYFPTSVLVTGWDIIFLWVARMIMASFEWKGKIPFRKVYFTGMVRDKQRRKMSKSLGNSPDALQLIADYGADGVRFGILASSPAGGDLLFDDKLCEQGRNFSNKLWNALRLVKNWESQLGGGNKPQDELLIQWIQNRKNELCLQVASSFEQLKLSDALKQIYAFVWDDYCSFFLEAVKPPKGEQISPELFATAEQIFENICSLLHPFMPFITEEIWQHLKEREPSDFCMLSAYPAGQSADREVLDFMQELRDVIKKIRELKATHQVSRDVKAPLYILNRNQKTLIHHPGYVYLLIKFCNLNEVELTDSEIKNAQSFLGLRDTYYLDLPVQLDVAAEKLKLEEEINYAEGFLQSVLKKLENPKFVESAPADLVAKERKKLEDGELRLKSLRERFESL
ncbi:MAG: valine--tRNA ligase [Saprospiraceae bacterium]|nr:valine--tRNA ligase [Saprospiraceae bacterium]